MSYMALYRKFRPQTFEQVKGQDHVVRALKNQIKNNRIGHAYLFTGTRGTGKTSVAKLFARAINCLNPKDGDPCNECEACRAAARDSFMDIVEVDAASNTSVDDIRRIIEEIQYTPVSGRYKVYIIDEAHMLSGSAFNAFLKTLEEPPSYAVFILATTEPQKLPVTILSRCQRYDFHRISNAEIAANLRELVNKENVEAEDKALEYVAMAGDGSMRDAISLLDKCIAFNLGDALTYDRVLQTLGTVDTVVFSRIFRSVYAGNAASALKELEQAVHEGKEISQFASDLIWYMRSLLLAGVGGSSSQELLGVSHENMQLLKEDAALAEPAVLMRYIRILSELINEIRFSPVKQILVEVALIKLAMPQMGSDPDSQLDRIRQLEMNSRDTQQPQPAIAAQAVIQPQPAGRREVQPALETVQADIMNESPQPQMMPQRAAMPDVQTISGRETTVAESWQDIISACKGRLKAALRKAGPGEETETSVTVFASSEVNYLAIKDSSAELSSVIKKVTGRDVMVNVKKGEAFPEELLGNINFVIETEEM